MEKFTRNILIDNEIFDRGPLKMSDAVTEIIFKCVSI